MEITKSKLTKKIIVFFTFIGLVISAAPAYSLHDRDESLIGPSFSNPDLILDMPEGWKKQPVRHDPSAGKADIVITMNQNYFSVLEPIISKYAKEHNLRIAVNNGTCGISAGMLSNKTADIGGFCCPPGSTDRLPGLKFHTLGIVALALIVHPDNAIDGITLEQARNIFMGEVYRWSELGADKGKMGANLPIQPVGRLHCKLRAGHWRLLLNNEDLFSPGITEVGAIPDMISQVANNENAIGYETVWMAGLLRDKGKVKALKINGYDPYNGVDLISGKYPLYRVYSLTTWEEEGVKNPLAQKLVSYLMEQVDSLDSRYFLIPASSLREAGWKFRGSELTGGPE